MTVNLKLDHFASFDHSRHQLSILSPPTATILKDQRTFKIDAGHELALVCSGTGDPEPVLKWRREVLSFSTQKNVKLDFKRQNKVLTTYQPSILATSQILAVLESVS